MKIGKTIQELAVELDRQNNAKKDFKANTNQISVKTEDGVSAFAINGYGSFGATPLFHKQVANHLDIPLKYYDRLRADHPDLLDNDVTKLLSRLDDRRLVRVMDGNARAFLSDRYRRLDNYDLAQQVLPVITEMGDVDVASCEITDSRLYLKVVSKKFTWEPKKGDPVQAGIVISNSEVGLGSIRVEPLVYRLVCLNGMIAQDYSMRRNHIGRAGDNESEAYELYADDTLKADDQAFWLKIRDTVRFAVDETKFEKIINRIRAAADREIKAEPVELMERTAVRFQLTDGEKGDVLRHLIKGADLSLWGLANAVTAASQEIENYDRATEFERIGGRIIDLSPVEVENLVAA